MSTAKPDQPQNAQLSVLYQQHAQGEPPGELDRQILAAARRAVAEGPPNQRRTGWWQRWRMPLTLACTVVLTASLSLLMQTSPEQAVPPVATPRPATLPEKATVQTPAADTPTTASRSVSAPQARNNGITDRQQTPAPRTERAADAAAAQAVQAQISAPAKSEAHMPPVNAAGETSSRGAVTGHSSPTLSAARPAAAPLAKTRADGARTPDRWLDEIRSLRMQGKDDEAAQQLREFRLAHPDYPLPEEFRQ